MDKILVTGVTSYVGTEVVKQLKQAGKQVTGLGRTAPKETLPFIQSDFSGRYEDLKQALAGKSFDTIMHIASLSGDTGDPLEMVRVNVNGCQNMLEYAREIKVSRFVLASSVSSCEWYPGARFYPPDYLPVDEEHPCRPKNIYSTTKRIQELIALTYHHQYEVPVSILRLTATVGPDGIGGGSRWREFAERLAEGKTVQILSFSAEELFHFGDIRDVARMFMVAGEHPQAAGEIFNCCGPVTTTGAEFAEIVKGLVPGIEVKYGFPWKTSEGHWSTAQGEKLTFDMRKAERLLGFKPQYTFADSIRRIKEWVDDGGLGHKV